MIEEQEFLGAYGQNVNLKSFWRKILQERTILQKIKVDLGDISRVGGKSKQIDLYRC